MEMKFLRETRKLAFLGLLLATDGLAYLAAILVGKILPRLFLTALGRAAAPPLRLDASEAGAGLAFVFVIFAFEKLYVRRFGFWEETRHIIKALTLSFLLLGLIELFPGTRTSNSLSGLILAWAAGLAFFPLLRRLVKTVFHGLGLWNKRVLVLGANPMARAAAGLLATDTMRGYRIVGFLAEEGEVMDTAGDFPVLGRVEDLTEESMRAWGARDIFIVLPDASTDRLIEIARRAEPLAETLKILPPLGSLNRLGVEVDMAGDILTLAVTRNLLKPWNILAKKAFDLFFAALLLVLLSPLLLLLGLAVAIDSRGPIIFRQSRLGRNDRLFTILKFRSMHVDAEGRLAAFLASHPQARLELQKFRKLKSADPRTTRIGRLIRKRSLDELPQLLNVLRGQMSLVGPRPYLPEEKPVRDGLSGVLSLVPPGITGRWQIDGRNERTFEERVRIDDAYVRNWSLWLDIIILFKTFGVWIKGRGAC